MKMLHVLERIIWILLGLMLMWEFGLRGEENAVDPVPIVRQSFTPFMSKKLSIDLVKGKGQGIVTTKEVKAGEVLIYDKPLFNVTLVNGRSVDAVFVDFILQPENGMLRLVLDELHSSSAVERALDERSGVYQELTPKGREYAAKVMTNKINYVVYPKISKINHGYPTNIALLPVRDGSDEMMVVATDDIPVGAEIQYDYLTPITKHPRMQSQLHLHELKLSKEENALIRFLSNPNVTDAAQGALLHHLYANGIVSDGDYIGFFNNARRSISDERFNLLTQCFPKLTKGLRLSLWC